MSVVLICMMIQSIEKRAVDLLDGHGDDSNEENVS